MTSTDQKHQDRMDALRLHLQQVHCNEAALDLTNRDAVEYHHHEHHGPGGLRNHDQPPQLHDWRWFGGVDGKAGPPAKVSAFDRVAAAIQAEQSNPTHEDLTDAAVSAVLDVARELGRLNPEHAAAYDLLANELGYL